MAWLRWSREALADWSTVVMALCAIGVAGMVARQQLREPTAGPVADRNVKQWDDYLAGGRRVGPDHARVTIVEFGDYECPYCRAFEPALRAALAAHPDDVALVYHYVPIPYHQHAYEAARLAECAAREGRFREAHHYLYDREDLGNIELSRFAVAVRVRDTSTLFQCARDTKPVPEIEEDLARARRLQITSTPTVVVNGLQLGMTPDSARLFDLLREDGSN